MLWGKKKKKKKEIPQTFALLNLWRFSTLAYLAETLVKLYKASFFISLVFLNGAQGVSCFVLTPLIISLSLF